jgi:dynein heavy chain
VFDDGPARDFDKKEKAQIIEQSFIFAAVWSLCITVNTEFRRPFDLQFKKICNGEIEGLPKLKNKILPSAFDRGTIYDYRYIPDKNEWKNWMDFTNKEDIDKFPKNSIVQEIIVTTNDTIRYGFILEMFIQANIPTLFVGPTGTGKTAYIQNVLNSKLPDDKYQVIEVGFSA